MLSLVHYTYGPRWRSFVLITSMLLYLGSFHELYAQDLTTSDLSVAAVPSIPTLLTPLNGATNVPMTVMLRWDLSTDATRYNVEVATDAEFVNKIRQINVPGGQSGFSAPANGATYWWRVYAEGPGGKSDYSARFSFTTTTDLNAYDAPGIPTLLTPLNGALDVPNTVDLRWTAVAGATRYNVEVATDSEFHSRILSENVGQPHFTGFAAPKQGATYWWRANAEGPGGESAFSQKFSFTTILLIPDVPTLLTPLNNAVGVPMTVDLRWTSSANATRYNVEVATDSEFHNRIMHENVGMPHFTAFQAPTPGTTYWWRVNAEGPGGQSKYSKPFHFTTVVLNTGIPALVNPPDMAIDQPNRLELEWTSAENANSYRVRLFADSAMTSEVFQYTTTDTKARFHSAVAGQMYFWEVEAVSQWGGATSSVCRFTTNKTEADLLAHGLQPVDGATKVAVDPMLSWLAPDPDSTDHYRIQVATDENFGNLLIDQDGVKELSLQLAGLLNHAGYYWRVGGVDAVGLTSFTEAQSFTTIVATPAAVTLLAPTDGSEGISTTKRLSWAAADGAGSYDLQVARDAGFTNLVASETGLTKMMYDTPEPYSYSTTYYWRVRGVNEGGSGSWSAAWSFTTATGTATEAEEFPTEFSLGQNYPNPFNPTTRIEYAMPEAGFVRITVSDVMGRTVATLVDAEQPAGNHKVVWSGNGLGSGLYYYRMEVNGFVATRTMTLLK